MKHTIILKNMLAVAVLLCAVNGFAQPFIGQGNVEPAAPPPVDSSQQLADRIISSPIPVFVDFWAAWCGPCRMLDPVVDTLKKEYRGKILFVKVNVDAHRQLSSYFRVQGIPAVFIVADSMMQDRLVGFHPRVEYKKALDSALKKWKEKRGSSKPPAQSGSEKTPAVPDTAKKAVTRSAR